MAPSLANAKAGEVAAINSEEEWSQALKSDVVIVDFTATWCGPCKMIGPVFEKLAAANADSGILFVKVDVDANEKVAAEAGVSAMPTFQVYLNGKKEEELVGASPPALETLIQKHSKAKAK